MSQHTRALIFSMCVALMACVPNAADTMAGDDEDRDIGLGGTGMLADSGNGLGGTGIVGEITGFGSIFVNGIEIEYDNKTPFAIDGDQAPPQQLVIGDVVEVLTTNASKHTHAQQINLRHEVIGEVETVNAKNMTFSVQGQAVKVTGAQAVLPQPGETVAVSGLRINAQSIWATRVTSAQKGRQLLRSGNELPFAQQAVRWLVQTSADNSETAFELAGARYVFATQNKAGTTLKVAPAKTILELQKNRSGELELETVINPADVPQGRVWLDPVQRPGIHMQQRSAPMHMNMNSRPGMNTGGG